VRLSQVRRDRDCLFRIAPRFGPRALIFAEISNQSQCFASLRVSKGVIRIEANRFIEVTNRFPKVLEIAALKMEMTLQISVMRFCVFGRWRGSGSFIRSQQRRL